MAVAALWYINAFGGQFSATAARRVDFVTDTINVALTASTYTPNQDTHDFFDDVTNELSTANGYTAGGAALGTKSITVDASSNDTRLIAATTTWTSTGTFTANKAVVYKSTGTASTSPLMMYVTFGADNTAASGTTFSIAWDATNGLMKVTPA